MMSTTVCILTFTEARARIYCTHVQSGLHVVVPHLFEAVLLIYDHKSVNVIACIRDSKVRRYL